MGRASLYHERMIRSGFTYQEVSARDVLDPNSGRLDMERWSPEKVIEVSRRTDDLCIHLTCTIFLQQLAKKSFAPGPYTVTAAPGAIEW